MNSREIPNKLQLGTCLRCALVFRRARRKHYKGLQVLNEEYWIVQLLLSPNQLGFLVNEWSKLPENAPDKVLNDWSDIIFRINTALHKGGIYKPKSEIVKEQKYHYYPEGLEEYQLTLSTNQESYDQKYIIYLLVALL